MNQVEDKRQAIFDATLKLISEKGFHGTAMSKVAKEAGVSTGIIYHYFDSKDHLIKELYWSIKRKMGQAILEDFDEEQPLSVQMRQICDSSFRFNFKNPENAVFMQQYATSPYNSALDENEVRLIFGPIMDCMELAQKEMIIKDLPCAVIGTLTLDVASSLAQKQSAGIIDMTDELMTQIIDALWEAIRR